MTYQAAHRQEGAHRLPLWCCPADPLVIFPSDEPGDVWQCVGELVLNQKRRSTDPPRRQKAAGVCLESQIHTVQCPAHLSAGVKKNKRCLFPSLSPSTYLSLLSRTTCVYGSRLGDPTHSPLTTHPRLRRRFTRSSVGKKDKSPAA